MDVAPCPDQATDWLTRANRNLVVRMFGVVKAIKEKKWSQVNVLEKCRGPMAWGQDMDFAYDGDADDEHNNDDDDWAENEGDAVDSSNGNEVSNCWLVATDGSSCLIYSSFRGRGAGVLATVLRLREFEALAQFTTPDVELSNEWNHCASLLFVLNVLIAKEVDKVLLFTCYLVSQVKMEDRDECSPMMRPLKK